MLLRLLPGHSRRNARPAGGRTLNPLQRRGRRSRWDPDYQDGRNARDPLHFMIYGRQLESLHGRARPEPRPRARADRSSPYWKPPGGGASEWRRIELEWERVIPAPRLAGRILALMRVLEHPERIIARTARRLRGNEGLFDRLREIPPPKFRKPKFDRGGPPPLEAELAEAQACAFPDTS